MLCWAAGLSSLYADHVDVGALTWVVIVVLDMGCALALKWLTVPAAALTRAFTCQPGHARVGRHAVSLASLMTVLPAAPGLLHSVCSSNRGCSGWSLHYGHLSPLACAVWSEQLEVIVLPGPPSSIVKLSAAPWAVALHQPSHDADCNSLSCGHQHPDRGVAAAGLAKQYAGCHTTKTNAGQLLTARRCANAKSAQWAS